MLWVPAADIFTILSLLLFFYYQLKRLHNLLYIETTLLGKDTLNAMILSFKQNNIPVTDNINFKKVMFEIPHLIYLHRNIFKLNYLILSTKHVWALVTCNGKQILEISIFDNPKISCTNLVYHHITEMRFTLACLEWLRCVKINIVVQGSKSSK